MTITCTRRIEFDAAHRVMEHESKCKFLHGHRYVVEATFKADELDAQGRVVDFGVIKEKLGGWIDEHWDHTAILNEADKPLGTQLEGATGQKVFYFPYNPTAENIARYLMEHVVQGMFVGKGLECSLIRVHETPNCYADFTL